MGHFFCLSQRLRREVCSPVEFFLCYVLSYCFYDDNGQDGDTNLRRKSDTALVFTKFILFMTRKKKKKTFMVT